MIESKKCTSCQKEKPRTKFYKRLDSVDGVRGKCKACYSITASEYYENNRDDVLSNNREWKKANPDKVRKHCRKGYKVYSRPGYWTVYVRYFKGKPIYVGQTSLLLTERDRLQFKAARKGDTQPMCGHIRDNERKDYTIEPLIYCFNKKTALEYENKYIKELKTSVNNDGCNVT